MDFNSFVFEQALILVPGLIILGMILKGLEFIPDNFIPLILLVIGIAGAMAIMGITTSSTSQEIVQAIVQGILVTGAAVYAHQIYKQHKKTIPNDAKDDGEVL